MYDLIIRGGSIVDGTGAPAFKGDIAIQGDRIVEVGTVTGPAKREIDAQGCIVTPGWVDIHTHYDGQATWDPQMAPSSWHGVTTAIMGNCGVGFAPVRPGGHDFLIELMEGVEDIPGIALAEGIDWRWEHFPEYLDALEAMPRTLDVGVHVPHAAVRAYVLGERCNIDYAPNADEIAQMAELVREGVEAGALGFSTSRTLLHKDIKGVHMPGTFAGSDEMLALGLSMKGLSHGVFEMVSDHLGDDDEWMWVKGFAQETRLPVTLVATSAGAYQGDKMYNIAEEARRHGMDIRPQIAGRPTGVLHGLQSNFHVFMGHPTYKAEIAHLSHEDKLAAMARADIREAILGEQSHIKQTLMGVKLEDLLWQVFPLGEKPDYEPDREQSVRGLAEAAGVSPMAMMYDLLLRDDGRELFYQPLGGYLSYNFDFFRRNMEHPNVLFGLSDGGAHCGVIADAGMPSFILMHWARDRKKGEQFPLEFLVRKLSSDTARAYGLNDRGRLEPGLLADINVIDFHKLSLHRPEAVYDLPAGGRRLVQRVEGYRCTIKSGQVTLENGEFTGALPGGLVRGGREANILQHAAE
ncbi:N-acyl-D-amino-acid deacylase family protein [Phenylobacterium montanum]|uniref:Amidohydrolase family protein n=1 Tax=Phenylobacterium montanum TaxID=2823693 RepID=A0A975IW19_9CAUL|nr:amidohydrolase family protein [Caulobacter sp. S6]QUD89355.1 amidohydrolase family protein [Caulobacter sp. S6]